MLTHESTEAVQAGRRNDEPALSDAFKVAAWVLLPTWGYIHGFVWAANSGKEIAHYLGGPAWWLFMGASVLGFYGGPLWLLGATGSFILALRRGRVPAPAELALFAALAALISAYWYLASLD